MEQRTGLKAKLTYVAGKLARLLLLVLSVSVVTFTLVSVSPIDPVQANVGQAAMGSMSQEQIEQLQTYWGVDEPPVQRYFAWAKDFIRGDMGVSLLYRKPVAAVIGERLANSLLLMVAAWVLSGLVGFGLGVLAGSKRGKAADKAMQGYALITASTPAFWLALLLLLVFSVWLGWLPVGISVPIGMEASAVSVWDKLRHAILPALTLSITGIANIALHTREKMLDVMGSDYVLFARARGESERSIVRRHALRNVLLPALTMQFASIGEILGGSIIVEQVFSYPGLGQAAVTAGLGGDVPLLMGITVISAVLVFSGNFIADLLYGVVDPRIRRGVRT